MSVENSQKTLEERVAELEKAVAELKHMYSGITQRINRLHPQKPVGVPQKRR